MVELSNDQKTALKFILKWYKSKNRSQFITLGGYAGTGKTTLISLIKQAITKLHDNKFKVAFCSYTGRATQNLKNYLLEHSAFNYNDKISTIHGLIYDPIENDKGVIIGWAKKAEIDTDLIIVDEASMVDQQIWHDLLTFNIPIIAVGDHGQLPPIHGEFNLMNSPHIKLEHIHRQEQGNPIITVSIHARKTGFIPAEKYGDNIVKYSTQDYDFQQASQDLLENFSDDTLILCGYNSTRNKINQFIRNTLGYETPEPQVGDRVICLRNNHKKGIYNGMLGKILHIELAEKDWYQTTIHMIDLNKDYEGLIYAPQFNAPNAINFTKDRLLAGKGDLFDFGYALTVHKAQGSQSKRVVLFEERFKKMNDDQWRRWLYTGITRAEKELFIFGE